MNSGQRFTTILLALATPAALFGSSNATAFDIFLNLSGIPGESADAQHRNAIDVIDWSWGLQGRLPSSVKIGPAQPFCTSNLRVSKRTDLATPPLSQAAATGAIIPTATLTVRTAGERPLEFLVYDMTNVRVAEMTAGSISSQGIPSFETLALNFESVKISYTPQKEDGSGGAPKIATVAGAACN